MTNYLIRRVFEMALVLLLASVMIFLILHISPGGPFDEIANGKGLRGAEYLERMNRLLGLDQPLHIRYINWAGKILHGDFGDSWRVSAGRPVFDLILSRVGNTLILMSAALTFSLILALIIGIFSAIKQYSFWDYLVTGLSFFGLSMPIFWFGMLMMLIFSLQFKEWGLPYFPVGQMHEVGLEDSIPDLIWHMVLPVIVLGLFMVAQWSRFVRSSLMETLRLDYIRTARAKGLAERVVVIKHALRNALIPVITVVALQIPGLFGGATVTETIFAWPGMGRLLYDSVIASDWPVAMGILIISAVLVVISNLVADLLYAVADPRIRYT
jgi:peptide/nickel transport system permease protein